jgi:hypothetical protein
MWYTSNSTIDISNTTSSSISFGVNGYYKNFRNFVFTDVLYVNHDTSIKHWFKNNNNFSYIGSNT